VNSSRGWYLVAVGVLALGISNPSISNSWIGNSLISDSARGFLDRAVAVADHLFAEAMRAFAVAQLMSDRGEPGWAHAQATIARAQPRLALVQAKIDANGLSRPDCIHGVRWALDDRSPPHCLRPKMEIGTSKTSNKLAMRIPDSALQSRCLPVQKIRKFFYLNSRKEVIVVSLAIP
jgi:hypothetical protein